MNGARSIFMRKGYLLTALAALLLLAASSGTASAQSVGFVGTSGSVAENATADTTTPDLLKVVVRASGIPLNQDGSRNTAALGELTLTIATAAGASTNAIALDREKIPHADFADGDTVELTITPDFNGDTNWNDENYRLTLDTNASGVSVAPAAFTVTVEDDDLAPIIMFDPASITLTEESRRDVTVSVVAADAQSGGMVPVGINSHTAPILVTMDTEGIVEVAGTCSGNAEARVSGSGVTAGSGDAAGMIALPGGDALQSGTTLEIEACEDKTGYKDVMITLAFAEDSLANDTAGDLVNGGPLMINILSDEDKPTVSFATSALSVDEGSTQTVAILADGALGAEVMSVSLQVSGDAVVSIWQDGAMLEGEGGAYTVDLGDSANTVLTISADSDRALEDGMTATATITISDADGANIGERGSVTVTVVGSTAVPALPLVGQLLLALFLMAGGARLYRRRQG